MKSDTEEHYPTYRAMLLEERLADYEIEIEGQDSLIDVLTDIRHLCDRHDFDFFKADRIARNRYQAEIAGEGTAHKVIECEHTPEQKTGFIVCSKCGKEL